MKHESAKAFYESSASAWARSAPLLLSDFTGRPATLALCEPVEGMKILDLGCGEGYCARVLRQRGASTVIGVDLSEKMIELALRREQSEPLGIVYRVGAATDLSAFDSTTFDLVLAMFLFNYLTIEQMHQTMREVFRVLRPGGKFVFAVPHPLFPFIRSQREAPFYFEAEESSYFSGRNRTFPGKIWRRDGVSLDVQFCHKTITDYFEALRSAGFDRLPQVLELTVKAEHVEMEPAFFTPLVDVPLHLACSVLK
jgi:SAM-dependent methyltransferase